MYLDSGGVIVVKNKNLSRAIAGCGAGLISAAVGMTAARPVHSFAYVFAGEMFGVDRVTHVIGYTGVAAALTISVGIDPTSMFAAQMVTPVQNVIATMNGLVPTTGNLTTANVPFAQFDFESVLLHEMGHSMGLDHINLASESGLVGGDREYTATTDGANDAFDLDDGADNVIGSADDMRGDDVNLNYFRIADNNPFATNLGVVDSTTYSRDIANLPVGDNFSANADRAVGGLLGFGSTEGVMQQGTFNGEAQRTLGADDVAGFLYARAGLDSIAGTADDYTWNLTFAGLDATADIVIDFDNAQTGFAVSQSGGSFLSADDAVITSNSIFFNSTAPWFFNPTPVPFEFSPTTGILMLGGLFGVERFGRKWMKKKKARKV
ncbi:peptidase M10A and M12B matrixin and adamalysin [Thalassoporum mexicanum PCC 7367]|uniref:PFE-CTERM domain-containing protein n=1 Tax=Thalassoporum mexicanum TaxID=3457544 RepID=UPI00029FD239|nr:peptidase M10 [Pseudanabaena sp. PCC 7367]AFY70165.1 peptidase M10A and M12B matrixin and adamalysin [Pseudanabaena sp. PCC 7367]